MDEQNTATDRLTIQNLPLIVHDLFARAQHELVPGATRPAELFVRYLRRKPGRGLAVIYDASERLPHRQRATAVHRAISLTLGEQALAGSSIPITSTQAQQAALAPHSAGIDVIRMDEDRKSTRLNSSHANISYAVFCLKK